MTMGASHSLAANLAERLVQEGLIQQHDLKKARETQASTHEPLGTILVKMGVVSEEKLLAFQARHLNIPQVNLKDYLIDPEIVKLVPERIARQHRVMPLFRIENTLTVAVADPLNIMALDDIRSQVGSTVEAVISNQADIEEAIAQYYGTAQSLNELVTSINLQTADLLTARGSQAQRLHRIAEEPPVVRLVNMLLTQAISDRVSDIHLEPAESDLRVRFRVDGVLHEYTRFPRNLQLSIISRLKIMSNIDISERRLPQDGRIELMAGDRPVDLRVATYPSINGEKVAIRILDKTTGLLSLSDLGFSEGLFTRFQEVIQNPFGLFLVVGPTGSGKTTTLYAVLRHIKSEKRNTMTIEDPVEYQIEGLTQAQVSQTVGLTFAEGLRAIVRQDPDIIMIGEIRDLETAEIAVRAALTGHQVYSTLHTNDASSAITRLLDMGLDPYLIASSLSGAVAQRLVRRICPRCRETYKPAEKVLQELGLTRETEASFYRGKGCKNCKGTGYHGRIGLFELMVVDSSIQDLVMARKPADAIQWRAAQLGMRTLREEGVSKVLQGVTTIEEILRVTFGHAS